MFERYTEKARRVIFFARYEASQFGASQIEAEHVLLGLMREDKHLCARFFRPGDIDAIREGVKGRTILHDRISTSVDLPLSVEAKRVLAFAAEESERLGHRHIGTEHLLLGLLREENSIAAEILYERGLRLSDIRNDLGRQSEAERVAARADEPPPDRDEKWMWEVADACLELRLLTREDWVREFEQVAALRQFRADAEALLRLLAARGRVAPERMLALAFELRDEAKLREFIEKMGRG